MNICRYKNLGDSGVEIYFNPLTNLQVVKEKLIKSKEQNIRNLFNSDNFTRYFNINSQVIYLRVGDILLIKAR